MANTIRDYSATAASNTVVDGADISEGCSPAGINDAIRGVMADLKDVSTGAVALESPAFDSVTGNLDVNGTVTADDNIVLDGASSPAITITDTTNSATSVLKAGNVQGIVGTTSNHDFFVRSNDTDRIGVAAAGDVSLYDSTGTTAKFFWDASTQRLGLGTTSPDQTLVVKTADGGGIAIENAAGNQYRWAVNGDDSFAVVDSGTAERLRIDSAGRVTMPYQPSFRAKGNNASYISTSPVPFGNVQHNIGGHFSTSTNRFTAPIAGIYSLHAHLGVVRVTTTGGWAQAELRVNGAQIAYSYFQTASPTEFANLNTSALASLAAGDYVEVIFQDSGGSYYNGGSESQFSGYLVG